MVICLHLSDDGGAVAPTSNTTREICNLTPKLSRRFWIAKLLNEIARVKNLLLCTEPNRVTVGERGLGQVPFRLRSHRRLVVFFWVKLPKQQVERIVWQRKEWLKISVSASSENLKDAWAIADLVSLSAAHAAATLVFAGAFAFGRDAQEMQIEKHFMRRVVHEVNQFRVGKRFKHLEVCRCSGLYCLGASCHGRFPAVWARL